MTTRFERWMLKLGAVGAIGTACWHLGCAVAKPPERTLALPKSVELSDFDAKCTGGKMADSLALAQAMDAARGPGGKVVVPKGCDVRMTFGVVHCPDTLTWQP